MDGDIIINYRTILNILITTLLLSIICTILKIWKNNKEYNLRKIGGKKIRKDLNSWTSGLDVNISNIELVKECEKYYSEYWYRYNKINKINKIEYVRLSGNNIRYWYIRIAKKMKIFVLISAFITLFTFLLNEHQKSFIAIGLIILFGILIRIYKKTNECYLYRIAIRLAYDEWGYYMTFDGRCKFIGAVQMIDKSKYHKYVYSFLNIMALCRAIAFNDKFNGEHKMAIITERMNELIKRNVEHNKKLDWVMCIPLLISAMYEFCVTRQVSANVRETLLQTDYKNDKNIRISVDLFLQSFWVDLKRKKLENEELKEFQLFKEQLCN